MKITGVILFFVILQIKASFFDDFRGAMSSVENAFGKLLNDVVTDVKSTVHCTILAMEHVLAINGVLVEPLANNECNNSNNDAETPNNNHNHHSEDDIATQIHSSISRVNKSLSNILDNTDHKRIQDVKRDLKTESSHLTKVSHLLRRELEKISRRTGKEFQSKDFNSNKTSVESLWNDMKILHDIERDDKNISEVTEIGQVLDEALNFFHVNGEQKSDADKIQTIMLEVEHETNNSNVNMIDTINSEISKWKSGQSALQKNIKEEPSMSSKDNEKNGKEVNNYIANTSSSVNSKTLDTNLDSKKTNSGNGNSEMNSPFSDINTTDNKKAIDEATDILNEAVKTQALMDELFGQKDRGVDVFNNSNLFNFFK